MNIHHGMVMAQNMSLESLTKPCTNGVIDSVSCENRMNDTIEIFGEDFLLLFSLARVGFSSF